MTMAASSVCVVVSSLLLNRFERIEGSKEVSLFHSYRVTISLFHCHRVTISEQLVTDKKKASCLTEHNDQDPPVGWLGTNHGRSIIEIGC